MKKQVFNPYLPLDTYIPDGEPHVLVIEFIFMAAMIRRAGTVFVFSIMKRGLHQLMT